MSEIQEPAFSKEHMNAVLAMVTATLELQEGGRSDDPMVLNAVARVANEVPRDVQLMASMHLIHLLVRQLARVEGRPVKDLWRDLMLVYADAWPEDEKPS
ncbi:hypothetical protein [Nonomuraea roseoviolacea]|uniref:DUF1844 domain-containing protein n=1 Tax=Nonomuraea roseoviolacea subsp. carminata TaxID=160689 RepID=A0ABT1K9E5_9ACTN|nr:hypothetical protein [Nonomuraea roseoviolacea]MCP2350641.1 hypothetical protein [Nonomuraea roseoviolacea subsp. carminata]